MNYALLKDGRLAWVLSESTSTLFVVTLDKVTSVDSLKPDNRIQVSDAHVHRVSQDLNMLREIQKKFYPESVVETPNTFKLILRDITGQSKPIVELDFTETDLQAGTVFHNITSIEQLQREFLGASHRNGCNVFFSYEPKKIVDRKPKQHSSAENVECELHFSSGKEDLRFSAKAFITVKPNKTSVFITNFAISKLSIGVPSNLHINTQQLIARFGIQIAYKLLVAQHKMGLTEGWQSLPEGAKHVSGKTFLNEATINVSLIQHLAKGDILDSIAYLMFMHDLGMDLDTSYYSTAVG